MSDEFSIRENKQLRRERKQDADETLAEIELDFTTDLGDLDAREDGAVEWDLPDQHEEELRADHSAEPSVSALEDPPAEPATQRPVEQAANQPVDGQTGTGKQARPASRTASLDDLPDEKPASDDKADDGGFAFPGFGDDQEEEESVGGLDLQRIIKGVLSRTPLIVLIAVLVTGAFAALAFTTMKHSWIAQTTLIKRGHSDEFQVGRFGKAFKPQKYSLNTMLDTLVLPSSVDETMRRGEIALKRKDFIKQVDLKLGKDSSIFHISFEWDDPVKAAEIANHLVEIFIERNRRIRRSDAEETVLFYQKQLDESADETRAINERIQFFQQEYGLSDIATQISVLVTDLSQLRLKLNEYKATEEGMISDVARLEQAIAAEPEMIVQSSYYENPLGKRLSGMEWELEQARGRYTDNNPKVIDLKARIDKLKALIGDGKDSGNESNTFAHNPVREELSVKRYAAQGRLKLARAQRTATEKLVNEMSQRLDLLTAKQKEYDGLKQQLAAAEQLKENLANRVNEARVIMLRNEADFEILERAQPPQERESSGRKLMLIAGFVLGSGGGLFLALLLELLDSRVRTRRDAENLGGTELVLEFQHVPEGEQTVVDAQHPTTPVALRFRSFLNDMAATLDDEDWQSLAIVSHERQAGRSLIATNLAQALGLKETPVYLIDADLSLGAGERPSTLYQDRDEHCGLKQILAGDAEPDDCLHECETHGVKLLTATRGRSAGLDERDILRLGSQRMAKLVRYFKSAPARVIYDLPALADNETALELAASVGNVVLVVRSDHSDRKSVQKTVAKLKERGVECRAAVVCDVPYKMIQGEPMFDKAGAKPDKQAKKAARAAARLAKAEAKAAKKLARQTSDHEPSEATERDTTQ